MTVISEPAGPAHRGPGRPRNLAHDDAVLDAVVALIEADEPITVQAVVAGSGVSRAAIYRRWPGLTELVAAALDRGRAAIAIDTTARTVRAALEEALYGDPEATRGSEYSERRFRARLRLTLADRELQRAYWASHVRRRRIVMLEALAEGVRRGELRDDLDLDACLDAIIGASYYQLVVRGESVTDPGVMARCRAGFDTMWRGMAP